LSAKSSDPGSLALQPPALSWHTSCSHRAGENPVLRDENQAQSDGVGPHG
jgi:hypothetical protein